MGKARMPGFLFFLLLAVFGMVTASDCAAGTPIPVTSDSWINYMPSLIQRQDGSLMIVYERLDSNWDNGDLMVTFSADGAVWTQPELIIGNPGNKRHPSLIQMQDGSYRVFYLSDETGSYKIHHASSTDGLVWTNLGVVQLGWSSQQQVNPTVCLESDGSLTMTYSVLSDGGYIAHSSDAVNWDQARTQIGTSGSLYRIMRHSDGTYLAGYQKRTGSQYWMIDIFTRMSNDRVSWDPEVRVTYTSNSHDSFPIELPDGSYGLYYATSLGGQPYDLYRVFSDGGAIWEDEENLFPYAGWDTQPHPILLDTGELAMAWARGPVQDAPQVFFVRTGEPVEVGEPEHSGPDYVPHANSGRHEVVLSVSPNPFRDRLLIGVESPHIAGGALNGPFPALQDLMVFDSGGRAVRRLDLEGAGRSWSWDGTDANGRKVPAGVYYFSLSGSEGSGRARVVIVR